MIRVCHKVRVAVPIAVIAVALLLPGAGARAAAGQYQSVEAFLGEAFAAEAAVPQPSVLWVDATIRDGVSAILGRDFGRLRVRYWRSGERTAWVLDEIGKEKPITTGIVIDHGAVAAVRVLEFRESRGWEVRYPFFTGQFPGLALDGNRELDGPVDGITGATLSVQALKRQTRAALFLHQFTPAARVATATAAPTPIALAHRAP